jgi:three-Cys-motif partner protein
MGEQMKGAKRNIEVGDDGAPVEVVGSWVLEKHSYLCRYVDASRGARKKFLGPGKTGATFADLFCAFGRAKNRDSGEYVHGSAVAAWKASADGSAPFTRVYIADIDHEKRAACARRLDAAGAQVTELEGDALSAASAYVSSVDPYGLHFAFLDPHSLGRLDFRIIEKLAALRRIDMLIHVSAMDMQRNLPQQITDAEASQFDAFAPGWRRAVDTSGTTANTRRLLREYWEGLVKDLGMRPFSDQRPIKGTGGQRLYWLMLASKNALAQDLWSKIGRSDRQGELKL